ncbi:MAG: hypothetical protein XD62_0650 [Methanosarcinales archeaon 56_1174]|nr:MAG: hypothetical protein XD62_0650 [Methanosarcinales archeaon 56_1174]
MVKAVKEPDKIDAGRKGRLIAQRAIDEEHLLRVIYEKDNRIVISYILSGEEWQI